jgi:hypothetical protein
VLGGAIHTYTYTYVHTHTHTHTSTHTYTHTHMYSTWCHVTDALLRATKSLTNTHTHRHTHTHTYTHTLSLSHTHLVPRNRRLIARNQAFHFTSDHQVVTASRTPIPIVYLVSKETY